MKLKFLDEHIKNHQHYSSAIYRLLDGNPDVGNMIYPISNLIHQLIENEIKFFIAESHVREKTYKDFGIGNEHDIDSLLNHIELKKYYDEIDMCKRCFDEYKKVVLYFHKILGEDTFMNSRYPIKSKERRIPKKKEVDFNLLYSKWTDYSVLSQKMMIIYCAYCSSNSVIKYKNDNKVENEIMENIIIDKIVENTFADIAKEFLDNEKEELYYFIKMFVKRNSYYDEKYVC